MNWEKDVHSIKDEIKEENLSDGELNEKQEEEIGIVYMKPFDLYETLKTEPINEPLPKTTIYTDKNFNLNGIMTFESDVKPDQILEMDSPTGNIESQNVYLCYICKYGDASTIDELKTHILNHPIDPKPFKCTDCPMKFKTKQYLRSHEKVHTRERPYKCEMCSKDFMRKDHLRKHERIHMSVRSSYTCEYQNCSKVFLTKSGLNTHSLNHMGKRHMCSYCNKRFFNKNQLNVHQRIHTNEKPYKCHHCTKAFRQSGALSVHRRIHNNERLHACTECPKKFITKVQLNRHMQVHIKPYGCTDCSQSFTTKKGLQNHSRKHIHGRAIFLVFR